MRKAAFVDGLAIGATSKQIKDRRTKSEPETNNTFSNDFDLLFFGDTLSYVNETDFANKVPVDVSPSDEIAVDEYAVQVGNVEQQADADNDVTEGDGTETEQEAGSTAIFDTSSYICSADDSATHGDEYQSASNQIEQVIEFDYDLTLESGVDLGVALVNFENSLLSYVGSELESSGCVVSRRQLQRRTSQEEVVLKKVSSLPKDELNPSALCNEDSSADADLNCYPITGYISAYYSGDITTENPVALTIRNLIDRGMSSDQFLTSSVVRADFITSRSMTGKNMNMFVREPKHEVKSAGFAAGLFILGLVAVIVIGVVAYTMKRRQSSELETKDVDEIPLPADVEEAIHAEVHNSPTCVPELYHNNSFQYDHSIASASTQMVSNQRRHIASSKMHHQEGIVEETLSALSEDEPEDGLPYVHPMS